MRYYRIDITNPATGAAVLPGSLGGLPISSLLPSGQFNRAALNIEFDIPAAVSHLPAGDAWVRIWGLSLADLGGAFNLNGTNIQISGGMSKGLPLANPVEQGILAKGQVIQAYGNWIGVDQTVDLQIGVQSSVADASTNIVFSWLAGTPLSSAISSTLLTAYPTIPQIIRISNNLVLNHNQWGFYENLTQFAMMINELTRPIIGGAYPGVQMVKSDKAITVWDGTVQPSSPLKIDFKDLLGQPTFAGPNQVTFKLVLRGDIAVLDTITLPQSLATTTQQSQLRFQDKSIFSGNYQVQEIRHYGNFRQSDAASWNSTFWAVPA